MFHPSSSCSSQVFKEWMNLANLTVLLTQGSGSRARSSQWAPVLSSRALTSSLLGDQEFHSASTFACDAWERQASELRQREREWEERVPSRGIQSTFCAASCWWKVHCSALLEASTPVFEKTSFHSNHISPRNSLSLLVFSSVPAFTSKLSHRTLHPSARECSCVWHSLTVCLLPFSKLGKNCYQLISPLASVAASFFSFYQVQRKQHLWPVRIKCNRHSVTLALRLHHPHCAPCILFCSIFYSSRLVEATLSPVTPWSPIFNYSQLITNNWQVIVFFLPSFISPVTTVSVFVRCVSAAYVWIPESLVKWPRNTASISASATVCQPNKSPPISYKGEF